MSKDKITRVLLWLRKSFEIIDKTNTPDKLDSTIVQTVEALGWQRLVEAEGSAVSGVAVSSIGSIAVPEGFLRLILAAGLETSDVLGPFQFWFDHTTVRGSTQAASLQRPYVVPVGSAGVRVGLQRPVVLAAGDTLVGKTSPAVGVGESLIMRMRSVDIPEGEYVPSV